MTAEQTEKERQLKAALSRTTEDLHTAKDSFASIVEKTSDGILVIDNEGIVLYANPAAEVLFKRSRQDLEGHNIGRPAAGEQTELAISRAAHGEPGTAVMRVEGTTWRGQSAYLAILRDITDHKVAEDLRRRLLHSDKLTAIGQLAAGVAHEVNNPASYIMANATFLEENLIEMDRAVSAIREYASRRLAPDQRGALEAELARCRVDHLLKDSHELVEQSTEGMNRIRSVVRDLSTFSRVERDEVELVQVNTLVEAAINLTFGEIRHRARLVKDLGQLPSIMADRGKLAQVMTNLLVNAAHSIEEGAADRNQIKVITRHEADAITILVQDSGCGMPEPVRRRVFEPFFTTKSRGVGTGLGLSLSAEIVHKHGGEIQVSSEVGRGSRITVVLPVDTGLVFLDDRTPPPSTEPATDRKPRVLIIDDDKFIIQAYKRILKSSFDVEVAEGGKAALECLERDAAFDVVVCDLMMPVMDGVGVYEAAAEAHPEILDRIVFCSGGAFTERTKAFVASVDNIFLEKPVSGDLFQRVIAQVAASGTG